MHKYLVLLLVCALSACATSRGFDRGVLRSQITEQKVVTDEDIKKALELKPQLPIPFKLGIYFARPVSGRRYGGSWDWLGEDKDKLLKIGPELKDKNLISDMFVISDSILEGSDSKAIRLAAARAGADAILIVNGISGIDRYNNKLALTYILLITPFFVPGTEADGLVMVNAVMWDVRNQYLYLSAEAEGSAKQKKPPFFIEEDQVIKAAKANALDALKTEIVKRFTNMGAQ